MEQLGLTAHDAVAVHNPSNMFYLTQGYTGEGAVYISGTRRVIVTDFRYTEQAERQAPGCRIIRTGAGVRPYEECAKMLAAAGAKTLAIETDFVTVDEEKLAHDAEAKCRAYLNR